MVATIPATSDGQAADSSALIDAAGLELSDLGSSSGGAPDNPGQGGAFDRGGRDGPQERGERGGEAGSAPGNPAASAAGFDGGVIVASLLAESSMPAQSMPGAGAQAAMNPPTEAQNSTSANLPDQGETAEEDQTPVEITIGGWADKDTNPEEYEAMETVKAAFQEKYPWITVKEDTWGYSVDTFLPKAAANQLPDLFDVYPTEISKIVKKKKTKVKPNYKKKQKQQIETLRRRARREMIREDIRRQQKERAKEKMRQQREEEER